MQFKTQQKQILEIKIYKIFFLIKVLRAQLELGQVKQEIDRKIAEKEEEFENTR